MSIRQDIEVILADPIIKAHDYLVITSKGKFRRRRLLGWKVTETIGMGVFNPRGLLKISK